MNSFAQNIYKKWKYRNAVLLKSIKSLKRIKKTTPIVQNRRSVFHIDIISTRAAGRIRTADLILTKDALYLLSYSSKFYAP